MGHRFPSYSSILLRNLYMLIKSLEHIDILAIVVIPVAHKLLSLHWKLYPVWLLPILGIHSIASVV